MCARSAPIANEKNINMSVLHSLKQLFLLHSRQNTQTLSHTQCVCSFFSVLKFLHVADTRNMPPLQTLAADVLFSVFDYLDALDCKRAACVSVAWMLALGSRYIDVGRTSIHNSDDAVRRLYDNWHLAPPLYVAASLLVWSGMWKHRGIRERLQHVRVLYLDVFGYGAAHEDGTYTSCPLPPNLHRLIVEGPMTKIPRPVLTVEFAIPQLEDIMINGEIHGDDLSALLAMTVRLRTLHLRDVRPVSILQALTHLPVVGRRLQCLHIVNPNSNEFNAAQVLSLLQCLLKACDQQSVSRLTGLSLPINAHSEEAMGYLSRLLRWILRPDAVVELVSIQRVFPVARVWSTLMDNCEPLVARVYWFMDDFTEVDMDAYHGRLPCVCSRLLSQRTPGLIGSFDGDTDLRALPHSDRYAKVSVSTALPRTFPRHVQCIRVACFTNDIILSCFAWLADATGSATIVKEIELHFQWFGLHRRIPAFPSLDHANELLSLRIVQLIFFFFRTNNQLSTVRMARHRASPSRGCCGGRAWHPGCRCWTSRSLTTTVKRH